MAMRKLFQLKSLRASASSFITATGNSPKCCVFNGSASRLFMSTDADPELRFQTAKMTLNKLNNDPGNEIKLKMYSLFKQATEGKNTTKKPGMMNFVAQVKWSAWNDLGDMTKDEAKLAYAQIVDELAAAEGHGTQEEDVSGDGSGTTFKHLLYTEQDNYTKITLNRPAKMNALNTDMYEELIVALDTAGKNSTALTVITGAGDYYCSGNDLDNFASIPPSEMQKAAVDGGELLRRYVSAYIDFPKPLVAAINGPAIGVSVTVLGLFDMVFASTKATFSTPFSRLGQSPEGCSSYTFPKLMGHARACEMMLFNRKLNAEEGLEYGLVTKLIPHENFHSEVETSLKEMAALPVKSLVYSKALMRQDELETLHRVNVAECDRLVERWPSEDCINAIMNFFQRKQK